MLNAAISFPTAGIWVGRITPAACFGSHPINHYRTYCMSRLEEAKCSRKIHPTQSSFCPILLVRFSVPSPTTPTEGDSCYHDRKAQVTVNTCAKAFPLICILAFNKKNFKAPFTPEQSKLWAESRFCPQFKIVGKLQDTCAMPLLPNGSPITAWFCNDKSCCNCNTCYPKKEQELLKDSITRCYTLCRDWGAIK